MTASSGPPSSWTIKDVPQSSGLLPSIAVTLWLGWNGIVVGITIFAIFAASNTTRVAIVGIFTLSLMLPSEFPGKLGYRLGDWMMSHAEIYFGLKTIIEDEDGLVALSEQNRALIFAFNPHDVLPYGGEPEKFLGIASVCYTPQTLTFLWPSSICIQSIAEKIARKARESRVLFDDVRGLSSSSAQACVLLGSRSSR